MDKIIFSIAGGVFLLGLLFKIFFALFFPDKFAEGASRVLFLEDREEALFRHGEKKTGTRDELDDHHDNR